MVKKTVRALPQINKEDFKEFLKEFLAQTNKKDMTLPPTHLEMAMIVGKPSADKKKKPVKKAIIPEVIGGKMKKKNK